LSLIISSDFFCFLEALAKKPDGKPLCFYQSDMDFLYVICGDGPCSDWGRLSIGQMIFQGVDVIRKMWPEDCVDSDSFAGLEIWGGVQNFLSHNYRSALKEKYAEYQQQHNAHEWKTQVSEIIDFLIADKRGLSKSIWPVWQERVRRALSEQCPEVHIPLLPL